MKLYAKLLVFVTVFAAVFVCSQGQKGKTVRIQVRQKSTSFHLNFFLNLQALSEKVQNLLDMNNKKAILRFNGQKFKDYVRSSPRNYSMVVMFTALSPSRQCQVQF